MGRRPTIDQMFEYKSGAINLTGFPYSDVLYDLSASLGRETILTENIAEF